MLTSEAIEEIAQRAAQIVIESQHPIKYSIRMACEKIGVCRTTLLNRIKDRNIQASRTKGGHLRLSLDQVNDLY